MTAWRSSPPVSPSDLPRTSAIAPSLAQIAAGCRPLAELYVRHTVLGEPPSDHELETACEELCALGPLDGRLGHAIALLTTNPMSFHPDELVAACNLVTRVALHADTSTGAEGEAARSVAAAPNRNFGSARLALAKVSGSQRRDRAAAGEQLAFPSREQP